MNKMQYFGIIGFLLYFCCFVCATLKIKQIIGPESIEDGFIEDLILDCDFEAEGEEEVVVKWFFNGLEDQIYQWIVSTDQAYASGSLKDLIDTDYRVSNDSATMLRALKFNDVNPTLSGNYTCKVGSDEHDEWLTKQVIVYSPATSFNMYLIGDNDEFKGDEVVLCNAVNVLPKPNFGLYIAGSNGSIEELPEMFAPSKRETLDEDGFYNISIELSFNSSYLEEGTTKFICQLSVPGTNYSETKSIEHVVEDEAETLSSELLNEEDYYSSLNSSSFSSNSTEENILRDNGNNHFHSSLLTLLFLLLSLVVAT